MAPFVRIQPRDVLLFNQISIIIVYFFDDNITVWDSYNQGTPRSCEAPCGIQPAGSRPVNRTSARHSPASPWLKLIGTFSVQNRRPLERCWG